MYQRKCILPLPFASLHRTDKAQLYLVKFNIIKLNIGCSRFSIVHLLSNSLVTSSRQNFGNFLHFLQNKLSDKVQLPPRTTALWFILLYFLVQTRPIIDLLVGKSLFTSLSTLYDDFHSFCYHGMRFL